MKKKISTALDNDSNIWKEVMHKIMQKQKLFWGGLMYFSTRCTHQMCLYLIKVNKDLTSFRLGKKLTVSKSYLYSAFHSQKCFIGNNRERAGYREDRGTENLALVLVY